MRLTTLLLLTVLITINQSPQVTSCPHPQPVLVRNEDGTYSRPAFATVTLVACWSDFQSWMEEWTDYPEKGGSFLRRIKTEKDAK